MSALCKIFRHRCSTVGVVLASAVTLPVQPIRAANCSHEQLGEAIDAAGEKLRQLMAVTQPALQAKMARLRDLKGWSEGDYVDKAYTAVADDRSAKLDATANELLARIDQLGGDDGSAAAPDCARIDEVQAVSLELQATVKTKSQYVVTRLDALIAEGGGLAAQKTEPSVAAVPPPPAPAPAMAPKTAAKPDNRWATQTKSVPVPAPPAAQTPAPLPPVVATSPPSASQPNAPSSGDGYTIDEIVDAARGPFGKASANLARVLEHAFAKSGRPTGYILGEETGGAFVAGVRYGKGTLYLRSGTSVPVFWHGPSIGADIGAQGASTLFLVYKMHDASDVFSNFTGIEGSAFVVGGLGITFMSNGSIDMAPIRSGVGLRLGANFGYVRFTSKPTWNPF